jgi:hypothetical protein
MEKRYSEITRRNAQIAQGTDIARCPTFQGAGSTGRRNTGVKSLCWGFKLQGLTPILTRNRPWRIRSFHRNRATRRMTPSASLNISLIRRAVGWSRI